LLIEHLEAKQRRESRLNLGSGGTSAATFVLGGNCTLNGDVAAGQTVQVQGSNAGGTATLTWASGFINAGTIEMESTDSSSWGSLLSIAPGGPLINAPGGVISAVAGSAGARSITGDLTNQGLLNVGVPKFRWPCAGSVTGI
jgi:hypothetical protein